MRLVITIYLEVRQAVCSVILFSLKKVTALFFSFFASYVCNYVFLFAALICGYRVAQAVQLKLPVFYRDFQGRVTMSKLVLLNDKAVVASFLQQVLMCNSSKGSFKVMRFLNDCLA